jgi:hypothetical protein
MAYINYKIYPNDPKRTKKEHGEASIKYLFGLIFLLGNYIILFFYFPFVFSFFKDGFHIDKLYSIIFFIIMAVYNFFFIFNEVKGKTKIVFSKLYTLLVVSLLTFVPTFFGLLISISNNQGIGKILVLVISLILNLSAIIYFYNRIPENPFRKIIFFTKKENKVNNIELNFYCSNCGAKCYAGNNYCKNCGVKIKKEI